MTSNPAPSDASETAATWRRQLIQLLDRQRTVVDQLAGLAGRQEALIEDGRGEALLGLLGQRQGLIDEFTGSQEELTRLTENLEERLRTVPDDERIRIQSLIGEIGDRLAETMSRDARDQEVLGCMRSRNREEAGALRNVRTARQAYLGAPGGGSRFADQRG